MTYPRVRTQLPQFAYETCEEWLEQLPSSSLDTPEKVALAVEEQLREFDLHRTSELTDEEWEEVRYSLTQTFCSRAETWHTHWVG